MNGYSLINIKGQVTIPANIRKKVGIKPQDTVLVTRVGDHILIKQVKDIFGLCGIAKTKEKVGDMKKMHQDFIKYLGCRRKV